MSKVVHGEASESEDEIEIQIVSIQKKVLLPRPRFVFVYTLQPRGISILGEASESDAEQEAIEAEPYVAAESLLQKKLGK